ncbi:MAG: hypothetical protein SNJ49_14970 [Chloracidobacterium sp.]
MKLKDIHPKTPILSLPRNYSQKESSQKFPVGLVAALAGMQPQFVRRVLGLHDNLVSLADVLLLLDQDAFSETFVPRSRIPSYLLSLPDGVPAGTLAPGEDDHVILRGDARTMIQQLCDESISCVVTSTPYWGMRLYEDAVETIWADGEVCVFGHEPTPEAFIRHSVELLYHLKRVMKKDGSIWWNLMDTYNTRTQIRTNAAEVLRAMKGKDSMSWKDHECRRYSAGHSFLFDGEQCMIPARVAERASRIGYYVKSIIH